MCIPLVLRMRAVRGGSEYEYVVLGSVSGWVVAVMSGYVGVC